MTLAHASLTVSLYWLALLAGRWVGSVALKSVAERTVLVPGLGVALIAVTMLLAPHSTAMMLVAVVVAGAGLGPVFPIGISRMLARVRDHRNTGWVFAMCASGGAVLPWVTGLVSTRSGSLRIGFAVPVAALAAILVLAVAENAFLREPDGGDAAKIG
jgi:fucose permease